MRKRKGLIVNGRRLILFMSLIVSLGAMGVGYAAWTDTLSIDVSIRTAETFTEHELKNDYHVLSFSDGKLILNLSEDKQVLEISGQVYPGFVEDIELKMKDKEGAVPTKLKEINILNQAEIANIKEEINKYSINSFGNDDSSKKVQLNINTNRADTDGSRDKPMGVMNFKTLDAQDGEIQRLKNEIDKLKGEIDAYKQVEDYQFKYHFLFEQSI